VEERRRVAAACWKAVGKHLEAAHDLLAFLVAHPPEQYRETTLTNVRLHRDIMEGSGPSTPSMIVSARS
jgi:hypothetical protein